MRFGQGVTEISDAISAAISNAALGHHDWSEVCTTFTSAFPGSYAALISQNFVQPAVSFAVADGIEETHLNSFLMHYSYVNPWKRFWQHASNGAILVPERDDPASQYYGTEFYEEWMKAVGDYDAAVGLRLQVEDDQIVYLPVHFSDKLTDAYQPTLEAVMHNARRSLTNALQIASYIRDSSEKLAARSALTALGNLLAFVVDDRLKLMEANQKALDAFRRGYPIQCRQGTIRFSQTAVTAVLANRLRHGTCDLNGKQWMTTGDDQWLISVNQLPTAISNGLIRSRTQFLIQLHKLSTQSDSLDDHILTEAYKLTASEIRLCKALAAGLMLADAAKLNGISYENGRQKLKSIFRKTGVGSQSDLKSLLNLLS